MENKQTALIVIIIEDDINEYQSIRKFLKEFFKENIDIVCATSNLDLPYLAKNISDTIKTINQKGISKKNIHMIGLIDIIMGSGFFCGAGGRLLSAISKKDAVYLEKRTDMEEYIGKENLKRLPKPVLFYKAINKKKQTIIGSLKEGNVFTGTTRYNFIQNLKQIFNIISESPNNNYGEFTSTIKTLKKFLLKQSKIESDAPKRTTENHNNPCKMTYTEAFKKLKRLKEEEEKKMPYYSRVPLTKDYLGYKYQFGPRRFKKNLDYKRPLKKELII